mmetsp:Transcript_16527/g.34079  ORF Transcript_16527/g.34079 Transcript_16527/m.34079 type:complete len:216 (-) Transcript_16527:240-887(-)
MSKGGIGAVGGDSKPRSLRLVLNYYWLANHAIFVILLLLLLLLLLLFQRSLPHFPIPPRKHPNSFAGINDGGFYTQQSQRHAHVTASPCNVANTPSRVEILNSSSPLALGFQRRHRFEQICGGLIITQGCFCVLFLFFFFVPQEFENYHVDQKIGQLFCLSPLRSTRSVSILVGSRVIHIFFLGIEFPLSLLGVWLVLSLPSILEFLASLCVPVS